jgi:hypothetical protein
VVGGTPLITTGGRGRAGLERSWSVTIRRHRGRTRLW